MKYGLSNTENYNLNMSVQALDRYTAEWHRLMESLRANAREMHTNLNDAIKQYKVSVSYADNALDDLHKAMQLDSTFASHNIVVLQYTNARDFVGEYHGEYSPARHKALLKQGQCLYKYAQNVSRELMMLCLMYDFDNALRDDATNVFTASDPDSVYLATTTLLKGMKRYGGDGLHT